ncbi:BA75_03508T0 [Komagataella pastoris]|uniref:BA75_03508T0 n=1 Tax=Komagataella pastoris TaxID=4922 RepID=A0A1B2JFG8_PICPA|nr:BA75_03508T0 [Komagataella pastoris]
MTNLHLLLDKASSNEKFLGKSNMGGLQINDILKRREQRSYSNQNKELAKANTGLMSRVSLLEKRINELVQENIWLKEENYKRKQTTREALDEIEKLVYMKFEEILELINPKEALTDNPPQIKDTEKEKEPIRRKRESVREEVRSKRRQSSYFSAASGSKSSSPSRVQIIEMDADFDTDRQQTEDLDKNDNISSNSKEHPIKKQQITPLSTEAATESPSRIRTRRRPSVDYRLPSLKSKMRREEKDNDDANRMKPQPKENAPRNANNEQKQKFKVRKEQQDENQYPRKQVSITVNSNRKVLSEIAQNNHNTSKSKGEKSVGVVQNRSHQHILSQEGDLSVFDFTDTKDAHVREPASNSRT